MVQNLKLDSARVGGTGLSIQLVHEHESKF